MDLSSTIVNGSAVAQTIPQPQIQDLLINRNQCLNNSTATITTNSNEAMNFRETQPVSRLPYEGISHILNPVPINVIFRGQLPSFNDDMEDSDLPDMTLSNYMKQRNSIFTRSNS